MTYDAHLAAAADTFRQWLAAVPRGGRVVVFCHFDADGLAAGALFGRALPRLERALGEVVVVPSGRDESAFSDGARDRLAALAPGAHAAGLCAVAERKEVLANPRVLVRLAPCAPARPSRGAA